MCKICNKITKNTNYESLNTKDINIRLKNIN